MAGRTLFCILILALAGCSSKPDSYAPPAQRDAKSTPPPPLTHFMDMSDPMADRFIIKDVTPATPNQPWRWTLKRPELRFNLPSTEHLKFAMDIAMPERIFKETGPVTLSIAINGEPFDKKKFLKGGQQHYEKAVPAKLLKPGENTVAIETDKMWTSKEDGASFGFILSRAGFVE